MDSYCPVRLKVSHMAPLRVTLTNLKAFCGTPPITTSQIILLSFRLISYENSLLILENRLTGFFLASKLVAGKSVSKRGKLKSIVIPIQKWGIHLHHWLYSLLLIILSSVTGMHFVSPEVTYGLLGGLVFQGIYCYGDWHVILINRNAQDRRKFDR